MSVSSRVLLEPAFLLHRRNYRESSLFLEFLTPAQGRATVLGKGLRRKTGSIAAVLFPFVALRISWSGRGELPILLDVETTDAVAPLAPKALACGLYLNELILHLLAPADPHPEVFSLYAETIHRLASAEATEVALRQFEVRLLAALGYGLALDREADSGAPVNPAGYYRYEVEAGPVAVPPGGNAIRGSVLLGLESGCFRDTADLRDAKRLMRAVVAHHLGGRSLRSRELFRYSHT